MKNIFTFLLTIACFADCISSENQILTPDKLITAITTISTDVEASAVLSEKQKMIETFLENDIELLPSHVLRLLDFILDTPVDNEHIKICIQFLAQSRFVPTKYDKEILEDIALRIKRLVEKYANIDASIAKKVLFLTDSFAINPFEAKSLILYSLIVEKKSEDVLFFSLKSNNLPLILNNYSKDLPLYNLKSYEYLRELLIHSKNKKLVIELAKFSVSQPFLAYSLNTKDILSIHARFEETEDDALRSALLSVLNFVMHSDDPIRVKPRDGFKLVAYLSTLLEDQNVSVEKKNNIISHLAYSSIFNNEGMNELERFLFDTKDTILIQACIYNLIHITGASQDHYSVIHAINVLLEMLPTISSENLDLFCFALKIQKKLLAKDEKTFLDIRRTFFSEIQKRMLSKNSSEEQRLLYSCLDDSLFGDYKKKQRLILLLNCLNNEKDELTSKAITEMLKTMLNINNKFDINLESLKQAISAMPDDPPEEEEGK